MLQSTLPRHEDTAPASARLKVSLLSIPTEADEQVHVSSSLPLLQHVSLNCLRRFLNVFGGELTCVCVCRGACLQCGSSFCTSLNQAARQQAASFALLSMFNTWKTGWKQQPAERSF